MANRPYVERMDELAIAAYDRHLIREHSEGRWLLMRPAKSNPADRRWEKDGVTAWDNPRQRWSSTFWTEIVCLHGGVLYVGGDIRPVIFASNRAEGAARVYWMGSRTSGGDSYLREKAVIGMGHEAIDVYDPSEAIIDVEDIIEQALLEREFEPDSLGHIIEDAIEEYTGPWHPDVPLHQYLACMIGALGECDDDIVEFREKIRSIPSEGLLDFLRSSLEVLRKTPPKTGTLARFREAIDDGYAEDRVTFLDALYAADDDGSFADWLSETAIGMVPAPRLFYAWAALRRLCELLEKEGS